MHYEDRYKQWNKWKYSLWPPKHWDVADILACLYATPLVHQKGGGKYSNAKCLQNVHSLQVVAECTLVDEVNFGIRGLELCTKTGFLLTSHAQPNYQLLG